MSRTLAVITARGGSKRIPGKNVRAIAGKPLITWTVETARACQERLHSIVLSTDDEEIAQVGRHGGAEVPFLRPAHLAGDTASSLGVVQHATRFIEARDNVRFDWVLLLQPTSPLRTAADIFASLEMADAAGCDSVVAVTEMPVHPIFAKKINAKGLLKPFNGTEPEGLRRQDANPKAYIRNGAIYLTQRDVLLEQNSIYGSRILPYIMPPERSIDIDVDLDFRLAELLLQDRSELADLPCAD
ncbi:acylneuraminate cytidylyltransferase family protein [Rhizobium paknamense]|uniref:CMP-N-acetylneuraminic acid synthetase n=1 Tax=Rhizobium paknamense TaxID=1206817 RepID=A0ABU0IL85_9HYPH|nr:acylneuraminate cytidylyltransferase family protein [Rhizobium paknamense]MDQ0458363.1 CMP-N-acetylneuraminic acid synthetase [Rhizobium paknamense]